jgi:hypothetical protein
MTSRERQPLERLVRRRMVPNVDSIGLLVRLLFFREFSWGQSKIHQFQFHQQKDYGADIQLSIVYEF